MRPLVAFLLLTACSCSPDSPDTTDTDVVDTEDTDVSWVAPDAGVITLETRDGVTLEADYLPAPTEGAPAVVLLHMIPPSNTRADWPASFRDQLTAKGWSVLAVDRRGAGGSGGIASEAYTGEKGRYDVEACAKRLAEDGYGELVILGASNGTTSMIDYAVWAPSEGLPEPVGLAFLSGGSYTEAQTAMEDVPKVPMAFLYPPAESDWPEAQQPLDPGTWSFTSYEGGDHGTRLFTTEVDARVQADLVAFIEGVVAD